jgi:uncharacterized protein YihD (DUF1040 family)
MKTLLFITTTLFLLLPACSGDLFSSKQEATVNEQAQKNLEEIQAYLVEKGLNPDDIKLIDPAQASDPAVVVEIKKNIDEYLKTRKGMTDKLDRMVILQKKMKEVKTDEDYQKLKKEYPDLFITTADSNVTRKN